MKRIATTLIAGMALSLGVILSGAFGQKGTNEPTGVARQADKPEVVSLSGTVLEVKTEPCKLTTGRADKGTHIVLQTGTDEKLEIHLGPEVDVEHVTKKIATDQNVAVKAFRTERLPESALIAQSVTVDGETLRLRDEELRPVWAGGVAAPKGRRQGRWSAGMGPGGGAGFGCAACRGGNGPGQGCGAGCLAGRGQGPACAAGNGPGGKGFGRGASSATDNANVPGRGAGRGAGRGMGRGGGGNGPGRGMGRGPAGGAGRGPGRGNWER